MTVAINRLIALTLGNDTVQRAVAEQLAIWQLRLEEASAALTTVEMRLRSSDSEGFNGEFLFMRIKNGVRELADASSEERKAILANLLEGVKMGSGDDVLLPLELGLQMPLSHAPAWYRQPRHQ